MQTSSWAMPTRSRDGDLHGPRRCQAQRYCIRQPLALGHAELVLE